MLIIHRQILINPTDFEYLKRCHFKSMVLLLINGKSAARDGISRTILDFFVWNSVQLTRVEDLA